MERTEENVILVDTNNNSIGEMEKIETHEKGLLHRAFSIFVFNNENELLLQRRAFSKYHSGGLWTNSCCSHPRPNETVMDASHRRLMEEMGFDCELKEEFSFIYKKEFDNGLTEHEYDHVLIGHYNDDITPNLEEVAEYKYITLKDLQEEIREQPEQFTYWFLIAFKELLKRKKYDLD